MHFESNSMTDIDGKDKLKKCHLKHVALTIEKMRSSMKKLSETSDSPTDSVVYFDVSINSVPQKRIRFRLYKDEVPITAENFRQLCTHQKVHFYSLIQRRKR